MNKKLLFFFFIVSNQFISINTSAQNMVPNPGFETISSCPTTDGQINYAIPWSDPGATSSDLFQTCASFNGSGMGIPANNNGFQQPHTGHGYAGLFTYFNLTAITNLREYMQVMLNGTLTAGTTYYVSYYISRSNSSDYATKGPGIKFTSTSIVPANPTNGSITPEVNSTTAVTDTAGWTLVQGSFVAAGGEHYITIGNFALSANSAPVFTSPATTGTAYYYIDDIYVNDTSLFSSAGINVLNQTPVFTVYPNPSNGRFTISTADKINNQNYTVEVINVLGEKIKEQSIVNEINISDQAKGIYFIKIKNETGMVIHSEKLLIQ